MIIDLPELHLSKTAAARDKHWIKQLTGVNRSLQDGYAFEGSFVQHGATVEAPAGTWFLEFCEDRSGSGYLRGRDITLWQASPDAPGQLREEKSWRLGGSGGWALKVRDEIAGILDEHAASHAGGYTDTQLRDITSLALHRMAFSAPDTEVSQDMREQARAALRKLEDSQPAGQEN